MTLKNKLKLTPFLRVIIPFVVGILVTPLVSAPLWITVIILIATYLGAWTMRNEFIGRIYTTAAIFITAILLTNLKTPREIAPRGTKILMAIEVTSTPAPTQKFTATKSESTGVNGSCKASDSTVTATATTYHQARWAKATATVGKFRVLNFPERRGINAEAPTATSTSGQRVGGKMGDSELGSPLAKGSHWQKTNEKIELYIDTTYKIRLGQQIVIRGYINPIDTTNSRYSDLMHSRGVIGRSYLTPGNLVAQMEAPTESLSIMASRLQSAAVNRIMQLKIAPEDRNMVATLTSGDRRGMDRQLRNDYSKVGVAHILSVSGLHMGFVLILANILLFWPPSFHKGHVIKNIVVVILLWVYACSAGMSPSVIRAALMMSAAQIALAVSAKGGGYNVLLGVATIMLAINPLYLFDVSFQMSFVSILAIMFLAPRLYRRKFSKNRLLDALFSTTAVGVAAQIGVMPIVVYNFGNIPLIAVLINPLIIATSFITISMGLLWLIAPISILNPLISFVIEWTLWIQNSVVKWAAATPIAAIENVQISRNLTITLYAIMLIAAAAIVLVEQRNSRETKKNR